MRKTTRILIIDDDPVNNFICRETIKMVSGDFEIVDFTKPLEGLKYISDTYQPENEIPGTILFLDLNMNIMTGWECLDEFNLLDERIRNVFTIYILSSSLDESDQQQANEIPLVKGFVVKPLKTGDLTEILKLV